MARVVKNKLGRKTKYDKSRLDDVEKFCLLGATDKQLADFLEVDVATIQRWKLAHPEFCDSIKKGKDIADMQVADSLYNKALNGDTTAQIFWLKNRRKEHWRDKHDHTLDGNMTIEVVTAVGRDPDE